MLVTILLPASVKRTIIIHQNAEAGPLEVIELTTPHRTPKRKSNPKNQDDRNRNQEKHAFHQSSSRCMRSELSTTNRELADIPIPANQGVT